MITQQRVAKNVTIMPADPVLVQRDIRKKRLRVAPYCRVSKSVTRFARNTLEGLQTVRRLKGLGIGVYFEKENVNTLYMDNEMILTFFFSQAQAESKSLSGNVKWGHRKNFQDGKVYYHYDSFLGYRKGEKIYVWRCLNRMENGKRICKNSPAVKSNLAALEARYKELLNLVMADSAKYEDFEDEFRITNEKMANLKSLQTKLELEQPSTTDLDRRMEQISSAIEQMDASITDYDDIRTRQLISTIRVVDKETLLIRFKDGTEITQSIEK